MNRQTRLIVLSQRLGLRVAGKLRENPQAAFDFALKNARRWGWLDEPPDEIRSEWLRILRERDTPRAIEIMSAPLDRDRDVQMRSCSPFAGLVPQNVRTKIWEYLLRDLPVD